ncbi:hypothetical protein ACQKQD_33260 [Methylobacterium sp. NPDC080182]|uniref:hypothetical protein n=1 Tax=Methylobacterium sp. NPDC080182 TaxID=3390590 RepID=UPI003D012B14
MTADDFTAWTRFMKDTRGWSGLECARQLQCGPNQIRVWKDNGAPGYIGLACAALAFGLPAWRSV